MELFKKFITAFSISGFLVLVLLSVLDAVEPITDYDVERLMIPLPYEVWVDKDGNEVRVPVSNDSRATVVGASTSPSECPEHPACN